MTVGEGEVGGVEGHGVALVGLYAYADIGEREVAVCGLGDGNRLDAVALVGIGGIEGILEFHVGVERVVLGAGLFLRDGVVERGGDLGLVGEELSEFEAGGDAVGLVVVGGALRDTVFESAEAFAHVAALDVDASEVGHLYVEVALCCPTAGVVVFAQSQFVDPHLAALGLARLVAHADNHGLHLAERRVTHDADFVGGPLFAVGSVETVVGGVAFGLGLVAGLL